MTATAGFPMPMLRLLKFLVFKVSALLGLSFLRLGEKMRPQASSLPAEQLLTKVLENNQASGEYLWERDDGTQVFITMEAGTQLDLAGEVTGVFLYLKDVTAFKQALAMAEQASKELQEKQAYITKQDMLYTEEHNIALTLQESLMTMPKNVPGLEFGFIYRSASPQAKVGGDFYDLFAVDNDKIGLVIGDVSGRGLEAAALTSVVKNTVKAYCLQGDPPALVMAKTNNLMKKTFFPTMFVTLFFGLLLKSKATLTYCNAGHPSVIIKRNSKTILLEATGPVIGQFSEANYRERQQVLQPQDILIFYTDGLIEARCGQEFFGQQRLINVVKQLKFTNIKEIPQLIFDQVWQFTGSQLADDVAILAVGWSPVNNCSNVSKI